MMKFGFGKQKNAFRYGVIADVGSGSVGIAIVSSDTAKSSPEIIWSYRERMPVRDVGIGTDREKRLGATILNAFLTLSDRGFLALREADKNAELSYVQLSVSAPWSYTVSRTITVESEKPFSVTRKLIDELTQKAEEQARSHVDGQLVADRLDLETVSNITANITENGYQLRDPYNSRVLKITLSQLIGIVPKKLADDLRNSADKIMPGVPVNISTFMHHYYRALYDLHPDTHEICLVDITAEATELGVVRDNILDTTTHAPQGSYSIARAVSEACGIPKEEALGIMRENKVNVETGLSQTKREKLHTVIEDYEKELTELFQRTGDALSIPKTIFLHTDALTEEFFMDRIKNSAKAATMSEHVIHLVTPEIWQKKSSVDSAILLSAYVFHKKLYEDDYLDD